MQSKVAALKKAAACSVVDIPLAQRQLCAARLITLADSLDKQQQRQQQPPRGGKGGSRQPRQQQPAEVEAPGVQQQQQAVVEYLGRVTTYVLELRRSGAVELATSAEGDKAAAEQAEQAAATLQRTLLRVEQRLGRCSAGSGLGPAAAAGQLLQQQLRAMAHLLRLLLLHSLADPASSDASLAADLDMVVAVAVEGQPAQQRQQQADEGSSGDEQDREAAAPPPHWHDTLMDVLLSLLARNAAPLPSAPLRDAVERVFRAFAEGMTATGTLKARNGVAHIWCLCTFTRCLPT